MANHDKPRRCAWASLTVIEGGRRQREEELLREFMHPGVDNLRRIRHLADRLKTSARLKLVNPERSGQDGSPRN